MAHARAGGAAAAVPQLIAIKEDQAVSKEHAYINQARPRICAGRCSADCPRERLRQDWLANACHRD